MTPFLAQFFVRLSTRFAIIGFIAMAMTVLGGIVAVRSLESVATSFSQYANKDAPRLIALVELKGSLASIGDTLRVVEAASSSAPYLISQVITDLDRAEQTYRSYRALGANAYETTVILGDKEKLLLALIAAREAHQREDVGDAAHAAHLATIKEAYATFAESVRGAYIAEQSFQKDAAQSVYTETQKTIESQFFNAIMTVAMTLVAIGLTYLLIIRPLQSLRRTAQSVARGDTDNLAYVAREDELGEVAHSFNTMLTRLRAVQRAQDENTAELEKTLTELARMDKTTAEERARFEQLLVSMADAVVVLDSERVITLANEPARRFFGAQIVGMQSDTICIRPRADAKDTTCATLFAEAFTYTEPRIFEREYAIVDMRGIAIPVSITIAAVRDQNNDVTGLIVTFRDVTELVRLEEARVSFLSAASHQLRTPLSSMRWFLEMLTDGSLGAMSAEQEKIVGDFSASTLRMIELVNTLLQFSRVEARRVAINPEPVELTELAREVVATLTAEAKEKGVTIEITADDIAAVDADKQLVWQAILNFLTNALRYSNENTAVRVHIATQGDAFAVSVTNEGMGVPEAEKSRIFEKFYRATNAQRAVPNGNGVGLAFVKLLVEDWGGIVTFTSEPNKETTFTFTIPKKGMHKREGEVGLQV